MKQPSKIIREAYRKGEQETGARQHREKELVENGGEGPCRASSRQVVASGVLGVRRDGAAEDAGKGGDEPAV